MLRSLLITALLFSALLAGGCTSSRTLTRRDYEETRDPFMEGGSGVAGSAAGSAGVASLDDTTALEPAASATSGSRVTPRLPGPKPIQRAAAVQGPRSTGTGIAHAAYPQPETSDAAHSGSSQTAAAATPATPAASAGSGRSWQGAALSNFLSGQDEIPAASISGESVRNRTSASASAGAPVNATAPRRSPAAEAAALSELDRELGGFDSFLEQTAGRGAAVAGEAGRITQSSAAGAAGAAESAGNFADFASRKRAEWAAQSRSTQADAKKTAAAIKSSAATAVSEAGNTARSASDDFFEQLAAPSDSVNPTAPADSTESGESINPFDEMPIFDTEDSASTEALDAGFSGQPGSIPAGFEP